MERRVGGVQLGNRTRHGSQHRTTSVAHNLSGSTTVVRSNTSMHGHRDLRPPNDASAPVDVTAGNRCELSRIAKVQRSRGCPPRLAPPSSPARPSPKDLGAVVATGLTAHRVQVSAALSTGNRLAAALLGLDAQGDNWAPSPVATCAEQPGKAGHVAVARDGRRD